MNKGVVILGGIIVLAVIAMSAFGFGGDKIPDEGGRFSNLKQSQLPNRLRHKKNPLKWKR